MKVSKELLAVAALAAGVAAAPGCGGGEDGMDAGDPMQDAGGEDAGVADAGPAPRITEVSWVFGMPCPPDMAGDRMDVDIAVSVADPDTPASELTFNGSASSCSGRIDAADSTIQCPQVGSYDANVTVQDPQGHTDTASFTMRVCADDSVNP